MRYGGYDRSLMDSTKQFQGCNAVAVFGKKGDLNEVLARQSACGVNCDAVSNEFVQISTEYFLHGLCQPFECLPDTWKILPQIPPDITVPKCDPGELPSFHRMLFP